MGSLDAMEDHPSLLDAALLFGSTRNLPTLLKMVLHRMVNLLGAERALFGVFDHQGHIEHAETHNLAWSGPGDALPISHKTIAQVRQSAEICAIGDASTDAALASRDSIKLHSLRFILAMPVHACDRVAGVLYADSRAPAPTEAERQTEVLRALAAVVGLALENVLLYQEQRFRAALLDQLVHDLRTPLQVVHSNAAWLAGDPDAAERQEATRDIALSAAKMNRMIDVSRRLSLVDSGVARERPSVIDLAAALQGLARVQRAVAREYDVTLAVDVAPELPAVTSFIDRVDLVLDNLAFNALKHARSGSTITLTARHRPDAAPPDLPPRPHGEGTVLFQRLAPVAPDLTRGFVEVSVHNVGARIPPELLPHVFSAWVHGHEEHRGQRATGLGLSIVQQCVRSLGGVVWVESDAATGTRFTFTLPVRPLPTSLRAPSVFPTGAPGAVR
jgi:signal transduction histidine kinase